MSLFAIFTLAGILLCISRHRGWGIVCFVIALIALLATLG